MQFKRNVGNLRLGLCKNSNGKKIIEWLFRKTSLCLTLSSQFHRQAYHVHEIVLLFRTTILLFLFMEHFRLDVPEFGICISWNIAVMLHLF